MHRMAAVILAFPPTTGNGPDRRLRVAYVLLREPAYSETFIEAEIDAVRAVGVDVRVFTARAGGETRAAGARHAVGALAGDPVWGLARAGRFGPGYAARGLLAAGYASALREPVRAFAPDVVHTHFVNLPTAVATLVGEALGAPVTAVAHAADFLTGGNRKALARRLAALSHLFVISGAARGQLEARGVDLARVPHSVVRAAFDGVLAEPPGRDPGRPIRLVTVARLVAKKGVDTAVAAVHRLRVAGLDVRYDVFGDGPESARLRQRIEAYGLGDRVTLHGAAAHGTAMAALATADLAVLPCRRAHDGDLDGIPVFLIEAASRGIPVVTTAVSGIPELVDATRGWLAPPDDPAGLADTISAALADPAAARLRSDALRERVRTEFSPALQAERLVAVWRRLGTPALSTARRG
jgi:glycosyltransferase involved in cell wall biosynthesis